MKCPFCAHVDDKVIDSREGRVGDTIRRRRECLKCGRRFTTYERIDEIPYMVAKKDGRRERFERQKILQGLLKACEKRPVATPKLEAIVDEIEGVVHEATERELTTAEIGEMIMRGLKKLDKVAYVRFASVYMDFKDVQEFMSELKEFVERPLKEVTGTKNNYAQTNRSGGFFIRNGLGSLMHLQRGSPRGANAR